MDKKSIGILQKSRLFEGLSESDFLLALSLTGAREASYSKGELLHKPYTVMREFGIVISGVAEACADDIEGNKIIMADVTEGGTFGESLCFLKTDDSPVYISATRDCTVVWLTPFAIFAGNDVLSRSLAERFTAMLASRTLSMNNRIQILSKLRLRDKLITYFTELSAAAGSLLFTVPMNREDMAAYIGTDRAALSRELSKMKADGLIDYYRSDFKIIKK